MSKLITYQDLLEAKEKGAQALADFIQSAINWHIGTDDYKLAQQAVEYDRQQNTAIMNFVKFLYDSNLNQIEDPTTKIKPIPSNFFHDLNVLRVMYSLGKGIIFKNDKTSKEIAINLVEKMTKAAVLGEEQGQSFIFKNNDKLEVFPLTQFVPLIDEETGFLMAGIRHWQIADNKPKYATLYEPEGSTRFKADKKSDKTEYVALDDNPVAYLTNISKAKVDEAEIIESVENYNGALPIVAFHANEYDDSSLVGMKESIDAYDLILSGFADNVENCQEVYWLIDGANGMNDKDRSKFLNNLLFHKTGTYDSQQGQKITPYTTPVPTEAHEVALAQMRKQIYSDFGAVDVKEISAAAKTATEINAAYEPMNQRAKEFEKQVEKCIMKLAALSGIPEEDAIPEFKRSPVVNQLEQTTMVLAAQNVLDDETILENLPFIPPDKVDEVMKRKAKEQNDRFVTTGINNNSANEAGEGGTDD